MRGQSPHGVGRARLAGALTLLLVLLVAASREERPRLRHDPGVHPPTPPLLGVEEAEPLSRLARRHTEQGATIEVIYADPLLPADEAGHPVFRVVAVYSPGAAGHPPFPADLASCAQLRTSDGRVIENLVWLEEDRSARRVLGYLCCPEDGSNGFLFQSTRWIELNLVGVAARPLRFRWPVTANPGS